MNARVGAATFGAAALVAQQVIAKALRDTLFLTSFGIENLPYAMAGSAILSGALVVGVSRAGVERAPRQVARVALVASAVLLLGTRVVSDASPHLAAALTYVHAGSLSAATVSVFWSLVSESFDPYAARGSVPRIMAGATLGGVLGGLVAWRASAAVAPADLLVVCAALNLATLVAVSRLPARARHATVIGAPAGGWRSVLREVPHLRPLALFVLTGAATQAVLDYLLSSAAVTTLGTGPRLLSFFALFQTAVGGLSFLVQVGVSRTALERFGVAPALAASPLLLLGGLLVAAMLPPLAGGVLLRGSDGVVGASIQRSGYEVLFAPIAPAKKRAAKPLLDVGCDRLGMLLGSAVVAAVVAISGASAALLLLAVVALLAAVRLVLSPKLQGDYRESLAENLRSGRLELSGGAVLDRGTIGALSGTGELNRAALLRAIASFRAGQEHGDAPEGARLSIAAFDLPVAPEPDSGVERAEGDDALATFRALRSGEPDRVLAALRRRTTEPVLAPQVVELLGEDRVARAAADWLAAQEPPPVGVLIDALLSERLSERGRRRVARILGKVEDPRAAAGLLAALPRVPTGVRPGLIDAVTRASGRAQLARKPLLDAVKTFAREPPAGDGRAETSTIFALLAAAYPGEPIRRAARALEGGGEGRGTALEWLDVLLPQDVKAALWPRIVKAGERLGPRRRAAQELRRALATPAIVLTPRGRKPAT